MTGEYVRDIAEGAPMPSDELEVHWSDNIVAVFVPPARHSWYQRRFAELNLAPHLTSHDSTDTETPLPDYFEMKFHTAEDAETYAGEIGRLLDSYEQVSAAVHNSDSHQSEIDSF